MNLNYAELVRNKHIKMRLVMGNSEIYKFLR